MPKLNDRSSINQRDHTVSANPARPIFRLMTVLWAGLAIIPSASAQEATQTPRQALAYEKQDRLTNDSFYKTPAPLPAGQPGDLIRSETATDYDLPEGARAVRILYHSQDATGGDVAASGVVLLPAGTPPPGGWPVIAWAHGTSGVAQVCAPSMMKDVYYGEEGLFPMVRAGFAVVAPDYAGLGTKGPHQYVDRLAQANDVINSVTAARVAVPHLSEKWVVDGHSQGGGAAWGVAENEATLDDPGYLGAVVVAGTIDPHWFMLFNAMNRDESFYTVYAAYAVKARFPEFKVEDMLTAKALAHYKSLTTTGCWYYGEATARSGALGKVVKPGWTKNKWVASFMLENETMKLPVAGPLFVLAGGADHSVPPGSIRHASEKACAKGYTIEFRLYPELDHDPLMEKSTPDQISWIKDRFSGKPAPSNCPSLKP